MSSGVGGTVGATVPPWHTAAARRVDGPVSVVEMITFRLAPGVSEGDFLEADARMQAEFCYRQPGIVRRTTARGNGGDWITVVLWGSMAQADAADERSRRDPVASALAGLVEGVETRRYTTLD